MLRDVLVDALLRQNLETPPRVSPPIPGTWSATVCSTMCSWIRSCGRARITSAIFSPDLWHQEYHRLLHDVLVSSLLWQSLETPPRFPHPICGTRNAAVCSTMCSWVRSCGRALKHLRDFLLSAQRCVNTTSIPRTCRTSAHVNFSHAQSLLFPPCLTSSAHSTSASNPSSSVFLSHGDDHCDDPHHVEPQIPAGYEPNDLTEHTDVLP